MKPFKPIETERLILRRWNIGADLTPFARINADPRVMEYFESTLNKKQTLEMLQRMDSRFDQQGFCFCAAELKATKELIGFIGLNIPGYPTPFTPCVEIGWRLAYEHWDLGYATEGALACLKYGWEELNLQEIVSFTSDFNRRSRKVMEKIGMTYNEDDDFEHPMVKEGHPTRSHVLYRIKRP